MAYSRFFLTPKQNRTCPIYVTYWQRPRLWGGRQWLQQASRQQPKRPVRPLRSANVAGDYTDKSFGMHAAGDGHMFGMMAGGKLAAGMLLTVGQKFALTGAESGLANRN